MKTKRSISVSCMVCGVSLGVEIEDAEINDPRIFAEITKHRDFLKKHMETAHKWTRMDKDGGISIDVSDETDDQIPPGRRFLGTKTD
jgi:hypothetical protein